MPCTPSAGQALQHLAQSLPCTALRLVGKRASMGVGVRGRHVPVPPPPPPSLAATLGNSVINKGASLVAQTVKNLPAMQETWVQSLGREDSLKREWQPLQFSCLENCQGQRILPGYSARGLRVGHERPESLDQETQIVSTHKYRHQYANLCARALCIHTLYTHQDHTHPCAHTQTHRHLGTFPVYGAPDCL